MYTTWGNLPRTEGILLSLQHWDCAQTESVSGSCSGRFLLENRNMHIPFHFLIRKAFPLSNYVSASVICYFSASLCVNAQQVPVDNSGWSVIRPSADSRLIYVSTAGDDAVGEPYTLKDIGADPRNPSNTVKAYRTIDAAAKQLRADSPDWLLLRRGDTWSQTILLNFFGAGKSDTERKVITYYGAAGGRPILQSRTPIMAKKVKKLNYWAMIGLEFYDHVSDPHNKAFSSPAKCGAASFMTGGKCVLIEDCRFRFVELGFQEVDGRWFDVGIRRNIFIDTYYTTSCADQANRLSGAYLSGITNLLVEENTNDHSGWSEDVPGAGKNAYDHGYYGQYTNSGDVIYRGNITSRPSGNGCQWRSGAIAEMNLHIQDSAGLFVAADASHGAVVNSFAIRNNVCVEGKWMGDCPQSSGAQWGIPIGNLPAGSQIHNNIVAHRFDVVTSHVNVMGIKQREGLDYQGNIVHDFDEEEQTQNPGWTDPNRTVGGYHASIGGSNSTVAFLTAVRERAVGTWPTKLSAYAVINYIREGFNMSPIAPTYASEDINKINTTSSSSKLK